MLNDFRIYNEDCLVTMEHFPVKSVDLVLTSPPYNMTSRKGGYADSGRYDVYQDWKTEDEYKDWTVDIFNHFDRILRDNSVVLYNFSYSIENPSLPYKLVTDIENRTVFGLVDTIIWEKDSGLPFPANERRLSRVWEFVFVFARKKEFDTFRCHKGMTSVSEKTGQKYYNVFYNHIKARNNDAETKKLNQATYSSEMCIKLLDIYCGDNYVVYDPFNGTGTTGYAAKCCDKQNLCYVGSEISKAQCEYSESRIKIGNDYLF